MPGVRTTPRRYPGVTPELVKSGRGGQIRTGDPLRPRQVRYQAALRPDSLNYLTPLELSTRITRTGDPTSTPRRSARDPRRHSTSQ
jgi:hypothetical protein